MVPTLPEVPQVEYSPFTYLVERSKIKERDRKGIEEKMAKKNDEKTNVMRLLEQKKIAYKSYDYSQTDAVSGTEVAAVLNEDPAQVFKTLVTVGKSGKNYVFVIPVEKELDLKKAASAVKEKNIEMIKQKDLLPLTGYIHGGCSLIGMKKPFPTVMHESCLEFETVMVSAGKIGYQVQLSPAEISKFVPFSTADIVVE